MSIEIPEGIEGSCCICGRTDAGLLCVAGRSHCRHWLRVHGLKLVLSPNLLPVVKGLIVLGMMQIGVAEADDMKEKQDLITVTRERWDGSSPPDVLYLADQLAQLTEQAKTFLPFSVTPSSKTVH